MNYRPLILLALVVLWNQMGSKKKLKPTRMDFVQKLRPIALAVEKETGIKADLGVIQAAHESGWGTSGLTVKANNLFGFKTGSAWLRDKKPIIEMPTGEFQGGKWITIQAPFRRYNSYEESYRDWARLMQTSRYKHAFAAAKRGDLKEFAEALYKAGYATDPRYAGKLIALALKSPEFSTI